MQKSEFSKVAEQTLLLITETIETEDKEGLIEIDFQSDIINLITDLGTYVINKHSAAKEIWLASPISGPYHFFYVSGSWKSKTNIDLLEVLERELKIHFNQKLI
jgi:CyaY protein